MSISLKNIVVFVTDLQKARHFYLDMLSLPLAGETQMMMEFFPGSGTTLGVALALQESSRSLVGRHTGITLQIPAGKIESLCNSLKAGGIRFIEPLESSPWGKMAVISDPDGNQLALVEIP